MLPDFSCSYFGNVEVRQPLAGSLLRFGLRFFDTLRFRFGTGGWFLRIGFHESCIGIGQRDPCHVEEVVGQIQQSVLEHTSASSFY